MTSTWASPSSLRQRAALLALLLAFVVVGLLDVHEEELAWYARLRLILTAVVGACLVAALLAVAL